MSVRITVMMSDENDKKIRQKQVATIQKTNKNYSYSQCLNDMLKGVKK